jgi:hypothetical protein
MAENKLGSRRGEYAGINATAEKENGVWAVRSVADSEESKKTRKKLSAIDKKRHEYNKEINTIRDILLYTARPESRKKEKEEKENITRWINKNIYKTKVKGEITPLKDREINLNHLSSDINLYEEAQKDIKEKLGKEKGKNKRKELISRSNDITKRNNIRKEILNFYTNGQAIQNPIRKVSVKELLRQGTEVYSKRKPLDKESREIRRNYNRDFKKIYDSIRYAKEKKRARIYINNKPVLASQITLAYDIVSTRLPNGEIKQKRVNERYILPKGIISGWNIGAKTQIDISTNPTKKTVKIKEKEVKGKANHIIFEQDNSGFIYTKTNIKTLFNHAEKKTGQRVIYINNQAMTEDDFRKGLDGNWYLTASAMVNIQSGTSLLSYTYNPSYFMEVINVSEHRVEIPQKPIIAELDSIVTIGGKEQKLHIIINTLQAFIALKEARRLKKANAPVSWIATQYTISESMSKDERNRLKELKNKAEILLTERERSELNHLKELNKINVVAEVQAAKVINDEELHQYQDSHPEYLVLSFNIDVSKNDWIFGVVLKSNTLDIIAGEMEIHYVG